MSEAVRLRVLGIGMGPQHVTPEVSEALRGCDYVVALDKSTTPGAHAGAGTDEQLAIRRRVSQAHGVPVVTVDDPPRDRDDPADYRGAVDAWHAARVERIARVLASRGGTAAMLVWGDPSLYDSVVRLAGQLAERLPLQWDVLPGISAPQLLAARHRIVLHRVGEPVHVTTARHLDDALLGHQRNIVVMLGTQHTLDTLEGLHGWQLWWSANLGARGERLACGQLPEVLDEVRGLRREARAEAGWVMDIMLLRAPEPDEVTT